LLYFIMPSSIGQKLKMAWAYSKAKTLILIEHKKIS